MTDVRSVGGVSVHPVSMPGSSLPAGAVLRHGTEFGTVCCRTPVWWVDRPRYPRSCDLMSIVPLEIRGVVSTSCGIVGTVVAGEWVPA